METMDKITLADMLLYYQQGMRAEINDGHVIRIACET